MSSEDKWVILTTNRCPWCDKVKELLGGAGIVYTVFDLDQHPLMKAFVQANGLTTVPQVYHNGHLVGGYEGTKRYFDLLMMAEEEGQYAFNF